MPISDNIFLKQVRGTFGKQLVVKQYGDKTVLTKYPNMSKRKLSPKQLEANEAMKNAIYYARGTVADPKLKDAALLRLKVLENKLFRALVKEYLLKKGEAQ